MKKICEQKYERYTTHGYLLVRMLILFTKGQ